MPSFSQAQLYAAQQRFTNSHLTGTSYNSGSYLVVDLGKSEDGTYNISVDPLVEIAVKDWRTSEHITTEYGGEPLSRIDIQNGDANLNSPDRLPYKDAPKSRRLLTVGALVTLVDTEGNVGIPLHTRNGSVPLAGKVTNPSGLASENPDQALWNRVNQEAGYCFVDTAQKKIYVIILQPDEETRTAHPDLGKQLSYDKLKGQHYIRAAVAKATGIDAVKDVEQWHVITPRVDCKLDFNPEQEASGIIQHVGIGNRGTIPAHVHDDVARQTVTLTMPLRATVPFAFKDMIFIDPEGYQRNVKLHTEAEFKAIGDPEAAIIKDGEHKNDGVPALNAYIRQLTGRPEPTPAVAPVTAAPAPAAAPAGA